MARKLVLQKKSQNNKMKGVIGIKSIALTVNLVVIIICSGTLIFQASHCIRRWLNSNSKAILSIKPSSEVTFPSVTVCPSAFEAYNKTFLDEIGVTKSDYKEGSFFGNTSQGTDPYDIFNKATFELWEILEEMVICTANDTNYDFVFKFEESRMEYDDVRITTSYYETFGRCFSFEFSDHITGTGVVEIEVLSKMGVFVYLHHPGQFNSIDSKAKVNNGRNKTLFIDVIHELNVDSLIYNEDSNSLIKCSSGNDFRYDDCVYNLMTTQLAEEYGCVVPYLPQTLNDVPVCRFDEENEVDVLKKEEFMSMYDNLAHHGYRIFGEACPKPCSSIGISFGFPDTGEFEIPGLTYTKIFTKSAIKKNEIVYDYEWVSMIAEIGGYTGLLLGISAVSITTMLSNYFQKMFLL